MWICRVIEFGQENFLPPCLPSLLFFLQYYCKGYYFLKKRLKFQLLISYILKYYLIFCGNLHTKQHIVNLFHQCLKLINHDYLKFPIDSFMSVSHLSLILMITLSLQNLFYFGFLMPEFFDDRQTFSGGAAQIEIMFISGYMCTLFLPLDLYSRISFNRLRTWVRIDIFVAMVTIIAHQISKFCRDSLQAGQRMVYQRNAGF